MALTDEQRNYLLGTVNELLGDMEAVSRLPRISEDEWSERFGELPSFHDDDTFEPLEDTKCVRAILSERDPRLVWSQIPDPVGDGDDYLIVPGYWRLQAEGWYLTTKPWDPAAQVVGYFRRGED